MELMVEVVVELQPYQQFHPEDPVRVQALHCKDMLEGVALLPETIGQVLVVEVVEVLHQVVHTQGDKSTQPAVMAETEDQ